MASDDKHKATWKYLLYDEYDPEASNRLDNLIAQLERLQRKYGKRAVITLDAGANNISAIIHPTKSGASK